MSRTSPENPSAMASTALSTALQRELSNTTLYRVKWLVTQQTSTPILLQNQNGPCALLAIANSMLITRHSTLEPGTTSLSEPHLMALLADWASRSTENNPHHDHAVADFLDLLPRLNSGMTINVRFTSPTAFEFTREVGVFDIFPPRLLHGWLLDPQDIHLATALGSLSYNQVIDELVATVPDQDTDVHPSAPPLEAFDEARPQAMEDSTATAGIREMRPAVMEFFESNPTQLTVYGLAELHSCMKDGETAILFRNSHFYIIRKHKNEIYTLVTDEGYLKENCAWEKLIDVNGDSTFYDAQFRRLSSTGQVIVSSDDRVASGRHSRVTASQTSNGTSVGRSGHSPTSSSNTTGQGVRGTRQRNSGCDSSDSRRRRKEERCMIQ